MPDLIYKHCPLLKTWWNIQWLCLQKKLITDIFRGLDLWMQVIALTRRLAAKDNTWMLRAWGHFEMYGACISRRNQISLEMRSLGIMLFKSSPESILSMSLCKQSSMKNRKVKKIPPAQYTHRKESKFCWLNRSASLSMCYTAKRVMALDPKNSFNKMQPQIN